MSSRKMNICDEREQRRLADYAERSKCASKMNRKQYKRYHSPVITAEREKVEAELSAMNPLEPEVRHFLSFEGFAELYLRMRDLYPTAVRGLRTVGGFLHHYHRQAQILRIQFIQEGVE